MANDRTAVNDLIERAVAQGWRQDARSNKVLLYAPDGVTIVTLHWTPSDHRWLRNAIRDLRRGGFDPAPGPKRREERNS